MRSDKLIKILEKFDKVNSINFHEIINPEEHVELLSYLVNTLYDTHKIRNCIRSEIEKKSEILRERACLELEL